MEIALVAATGLLCIICFLTGAKVGQAVSGGKDINVPTINPLQAYREREAKKEAQAEQNKLDVILRNIENYDGTGNRQEDVPRG